MSEFKNVIEFNDSLVLSNYLKMLLKKLEIDSKIKKINVAVSDVTSNWQLDMESCLQANGRETIYTGLDKLGEKFQDIRVNSMQLTDSGHIDLERVGFAGDIIRETSNLNNY